MRLDKKTLRRAAASLYAVIFASAAFGQLSVTGIVRPVDEVVMQSKVAGVVQRIAVVEGEYVQEGQLLVELQNENQRVSLDLSKASLEKAKAAVEETKVILQSAEREMARIQIAADALPRKELESISDQVLRLKANLNAQIAEAARAEEEVKLREGDVRDSRLTAPFNSTATEIVVHRGDSIRPMETPVLKLVALDDLYAELLLPSSYVPRVRLDQRVRVRVEGEWMGSEGQIQGKVSYINPTIDAASRSFKVKVSIPSSDGLVRPGMLVEAWF
jgi:RND family efflux transporter MFP subunit